MRPAAGVYGNIEITNEGCGAASLDESMTIKQCGILRDANAQIYGVYVVGSLTADPNHLVVEVWQPQSLGLFVQSQRGDFDGNSIILNSLVFTGPGGDHLLIMQNEEDGPILFDVISPLATLTAHDSARAIEVEGAELHVWHAPDRRETYAYRPPTTPNQIGRWEQIQVSSIPAP
jgi:hypothetical protein